VGVDLKYFIMRPVFDLCSWIILFGGERQNNFDDKTNFQTPMDGIIYTLSIFDSESSTIEVKVSREYTKDPVNELNQVI
jgi:hypothetical protein